MVRIFATRGHTVIKDAPVDALPELLSDPNVHVWVDMSGAYDEQHRRVVSDIFHFHPLSIEDCFEERERPKIETYDGYLYCITHGMSATSNAEDHEVVELDAFLGERFLVTYHSKDSRSADAIAATVGRAGEPLRRGPAGLLHAILDRQADGMEPVLDDFEGRLSDLEERVLLKARSEDLVSLLAMRRNILYLRRWLSLQRDALWRLARQEFELVSPTDALHFRDTHDHLARFTELLETYRELTDSIQEAYLSVTNNRLSENMRYLTLFNAVLLPLALITGIFGMNFEFIPGLHHPWGFGIVLLSMVMTTVFVLWFFRSKGWFDKKT